MSRQAFTAKNLRRFQPVFTHFFSPSEIKEAAKAAEDEIINEKFEWATPKSLTVQKNKVYFFVDAKSSLVLKQIDTNIKKCYSIKPPDRSLLIQQIKTLFQETAPFSVLKLDISSFFENSSKPSILRSLDESFILSAETRDLLRQLFRKAPLCNEPGLPRGLSISSSLSELYLRPFDERVRRIPGVFYYTRFVDDILIFYVGSTRQVFDSINSIAEQLNIPLNRKKEKNLHIECLNKKGPNTPIQTACAKGCKCKEADGIQLYVDYLGYRFSFSSSPDATNKKTEKTVNITIAPKKIKKIKTRIANSFSDFSNNQDKELLTKRLQYLTGTHPLHRMPSSTGLLTGNRYNYPHINDYSGLRDLDAFKNKLTFSTKGKLGHNINSLLTIKDKRTLAKTSFVQGFTRPITHKFTYEEIKLIRKVFNK